MGQPAKKQANDRANENTSEPRVKSEPRQPMPSLEEELARAEGEGMSSVPPPQPHHVPVPPAQPAPVRPPEDEGGGKKAGNVRGNVRRK